MADRGIKIFARQAEHHYQRGVAAARGGQKAVAERLLRQAVRLNPQHEQAWLWLSGVLDDPADIAFCLRSVLDLNPSSERARRGLAWLEQHNGRIDTQRSSLVIVTPPREQDQWWSAWRQAQTTWLWTIRALLLIPIILIGATLGARLLIATQPLPTFAGAESFPSPQPAPALPTLTPATPTITTDRAEMSQYLAQLAAERRTLRDATDTYRLATDGGRTAIQRATATQNLRDQIERSRESLAALVPPPEAATLHRQYLAALALEAEALDLLLEYYRSYEMTRANAAALRLQDARNALAATTAALDRLAHAWNIELAPAGGDAQFTP